MPGECCPMKSIIGDPDPYKNGLYIFAGISDRALPWECTSPCLYTMVGNGGQKFCMAPSDVSEVQCYYDGMGSGMSGYGSIMSGYGSMTSGMSVDGSMMSGYGSMGSGSSEMGSGSGSSGMENHGSESGDGGMMGDHGKKKH